MGGQRKLFAQQSAEKKVVALRCAAAATVLYCLLHTVPSTSGLSSRRGYSLALRLDSLSVPGAEQREREKEKKNVGLL